MKPKIIFLSVLLILPGIFSFSNSAVSADVVTVDHRLFADFLGSAVNEGVVDYQNLKKREALLDRYLDLLAGVKTTELVSTEQFTFYINAYNAWTIKLILMNYPGVKSIKELGSFFQSPWKKKICRIDGKLISLDNIEHDILRPMFRDPRIHFAVNCASKGCPPLRDKPYESEYLEVQLDEMTSSFLNNPEKNYLEDNTLYVSSIFKWYQEDFQPDIVSFFLKYAQADFRKNLIAVKESINIKYLDYDWSLNGK